MEPVLRISTDADRVSTIWLDAPGRSVNTCTSRFFRELDDAITAIERDRPAGVIVTSAKPGSFNAGADLFEMREMDRQQVIEFLKLGQSVFDRLANLNIPTVAAINGDCLGGGMELALACRYRLAADQPSISIGLPETKLGLIPGFSGTTRLPRIIGLERALPILLSGRTMPPRKAQREGLIDEVVPADALLISAKKLALKGGEPLNQPPAETTHAHDIIESTRRETIASTFGNYPAPLRLLDVVGTGYERGVTAGLEAERHALADLMATDAGRNLLRLFFLRQKARREAAEKVHANAEKVTSAAVIGGGTMGAGIAHALIRAGIPVRLVEVNPDAASAALARIRRLLDDDASAGRLDPAAQKEALDRLTTTTEWTGIESANLIIEAVVETMAAKKDVFGRLDQIARPDAVLASNTSSLRIGEIAAATGHPERVVGMHFFNPVPKMPLVEVVRAERSNDQSLATVIGLAGRLGKVPILVKDSPGFVINRILVPYFLEAIALLRDGVAIVDIDEAARRWGMPMGPFELLDEIGLDIAAHIVRSLGGAPEILGSATSILDQAIDRRWLGKKAGRGFYEHVSGSRGKRLPLNDELGRMIVDASGSHSSDVETIQWRLILSMVNESARLLQDQVVDSTDAIDLSTVLGLGLAPFRGGLVNFANTVGTEQIVNRLEQLSDEFGPRFDPAPLLCEAARQHSPLRSPLVAKAPST